LAETGAQGIQADLGDATAPQAVFDAAVAAVGPIRALVNVHTYDPGGGIDQIDAQQRDRHHAVNVRGTGLPVKSWPSVTPQTTVRVAS
jgi:3-oxoacyl-[acyl-carrier protein] reductase